MTEWEKRAEGFIADWNSFEDFAEDQKEEILIAIADDDLAVLEAIMNKIKELTAKK